MQREIKFRVWDNVDYMSTSFTLQDLQERKIQFTPDCFVMQYTGLKDVNGVEIYEGDVVEQDFGKYGIRRDFVKLGDIEIEPFTYGCDTRSTLLPNMVSVIGNIYQHPGLLQQKGAAHV